MKKCFIAIIFILLLQTSLAYELKQGESVDFEKRKITIVSLQQSKAVIQVDDKKDIINLDQPEVIDGVKISITNILYTGDESSVATLNAALTYICGDLACNPGETQENCCADCKCSGSNKCTSAGCISPQCLVSEDCNDNKELTKDTCEDFICKHQKIKCTNDSQCNDNNPDTDDFCSGGTCENLPPVCKTDEDCKDENPCTLDQCINKDCQYKPIENCTAPKKTEKEKTEQKQGSKEIIKTSEETDLNFFEKIIHWIKNLF